MACSCDISIDLCDGEVFEVLNIKIVKARKEHKCCECGKQIEPGDEYENLSGLYDGHWWKGKTCGVCVEIRKAFFPYGYYSEMLYENMNDNFTEWGCDVPEDCISELSIDARAVVCEMVENCWKWEDDE